ncbi:hypothetical protein B0H13DRAFT_1867609 [Mycena leptocephala]|nr:hypothetical protein B0H13DRAFT_1867609 [Mycena leptocephala]
MYRMSIFFSQRVAPGANWRGGTQNAEVATMALDNGARWGGPLGVGGTRAGAVRAEITRDAFGDSDLLGKETMRPRGRRGGGHGGGEGGGSWETRVARDAHDEAAALDAEIMAAPPLYHPLSTTPTRNAHWLGFHMEINNCIKQFMNVIKETVVFEIAGTKGVPDASLISLRSALAGLRKAMMLFKRVLLQIFITFIHYTKIIQAAARPLRGLASPSSAEPTYI